MQTSSSLCKEKTPIMAMKICHVCFMSRTRGMDQLVKKRFKKYAQDFILPTSRMYCFFQLSLLLAHGNAISKF